MHSSTSMSLAKRYQKLALYWHPDKWQHDRACAEVGNQVQKMLNRAKKIAEKQLTVSEVLTPEKGRRPFQPPPRHCSRPSDKQRAAPEQARPSRSPGAASGSGSRQNATAGNEPGVNPSWRHCQSTRLLTPQRPYPSTPQRMSPRQFPSSGLLR